MIKENQFIWRTKKVGYVLEQVIWFSKLTFFLQMKGDQFNSSRFFWKEKEKFDRNDPDFCTKVYYVKPAVVV